jgi:hypothetical protein
MTLFPCSGERNEDKYMVATQDGDLRASLRGVPSVGLILISRAVILMEPPSQASKAASSKVLRWLQCLCLHVLVYGVWCHG